MTAKTRITGTAWAVCAIVLAANPCFSEPRANRVPTKPVTVQRTGCCGSEGHGSVGYGVLADYGGHVDGPAYGGDFHGGDFHGAMPAPLPMGDLVGPMMAPVDHGYGGGTMGGPFVGGPFVGGPGLGGPAIGGPPPGTVGMTYRRASRLAPSDKHPRAGIVDVSVEGAYDVEADGMKAYRAKDGIWRLESKEPLLPGQPHIYHIKATLGEGEDAPTQYRTVRLIPGRIIDLQW